MKQSNRVKAAMRAGRKAYGYNLSFPSPWVIDILGKLDFDFVFIDGEHGPFGLDQLEDLCRTAERHNCALCWKMSPCSITSTPFSRCRASTCTALAQTILRKVLAIPASPTIRKFSRQCRKSQIAYDRLGARCNKT
jgi:hypothetical protein